MRGKNERKARVTARNAVLADDEKNAYFYTKKFVGNKIFH